MLVIALLFVLLAVTSAAAARCQISNVSYVYPQQAAPNQQIQVNTSVAGSCASTGAEYYAVRVDLVDKLSDSVISSNDTPIGYNANNFTVTVDNSATTPSYNVTWPLQIYVYVIRAGGTSGANLLDYTTIGNATIQVGTTPIPEFNMGSGFTVIVAFSAATLIISRIGLRKRTRLRQQYAS